MTKLREPVRRGAQQPLLHSIQPYSTTAGAEAVRLAAAAGLVLDPWQQDILRDACAEAAGGNWVHFEVAVLVARQNGKGALLEALVLAHLVLFGSQLIMWTAHEMKTALEAFRRVEALIDNSRELRKLVKPGGLQRGNGKEGIEFRSGARLRFVARSSGSGRGFSGDVVILDEAYALTSEHLSALMPTLSARPNPQIWYTSSPPLASDTGEALFKLRERAEAGSPGLAYFDWGLQGVDLSDLSALDLDDRDLWYATNPALGYRLKEDFTANERESMDDESFARERLGVWPARRSGASVIDDKHWVTLADRESAFGEYLTFAVDIMPDRRRSVIVAYTRTVAGHGLVEVIDQRHGTDWVVDRLVQLRDEWNPVAIGLDSKGPAGSLLVELEKRGVAVPQNANEPGYGDLAVPSMAEVGAACGQFVDAVTQSDLMHRDQTPLNAAVSGARTRPLGDTWAWHRKTSTVDISPLVAATLARWAYETRVSTVTADYDLLMSVY